MYDQLNDNSFISKIFKRIFQNLLQNIYSSVDFVTYTCLIRIIKEIYQNKWLKSLNIFQKIEIIQIMKLKSFNSKLYHYQYHYLQLFITRKFHVDIVGVDVRMEPNRKINYMLWPSQTQAYFILFLIHNSIINITIMY